MTTTATERCIDKYATPGERGMAGRLIRAALDKGYLVSVNDGEETTVRRARTWAPVMEALATTGEDYLTLHDDRSGERIGMFCLIYGNDPSGLELIADHTDNIACCDLYDAAHGRRAAWRGDE